jgi:hypothetical protein
MATYFRFSFAFTPMQRRWSSPQCMRAEPYLAVVFNALSSKIVVGRWKLRCIWNSDFFGKVEFWELAKSERTRVRDCAVCGYEWCASTADMLKLGRFAEIAHFG